MDSPLWKPSSQRVQSSQLFQFMEHIKANHGAFEDFQSVYAWSIQKPEAFWKAFWDFAGVKASVQSQTVLQKGKRFWEGRFFPDAKLNFAENLLRRKDDTPALIFWGEDRVRETITFRQLHSSVDALSAFLAESGLKLGDHVAAVLPNKSETVVALLAATRLGAVWSSCSPDFGASSLLDRLGQVQPKVLFFTDGYFYNGKFFDCLEKLPELLAGLPSVEHVIIVPYLSHLVPQSNASAIPLAGKKSVFWHGALEKGKQLPTPGFTQVPFNHPLYILFSSGTTGVPKCIVHGTGGTLLEHLKEHQLHCDIKLGDKVFYFTTCSWMMWNWLVTALASEATLLLYDGSPFYRDGKILYEFAEATGMTLFGTSAKFLDACEKIEKKPGKEHNLASLRTILSTGSPLAPERFSYVYEAVSPDVLLSSVSGGTDIVGCFLVGNPIGPVWKGELQGPSLGYDLDVFDDNGKSLKEDKGELVCKAPFPSMPLGFWNDPEGKKFQDAYFSTYDNIWCHGDFVSRTPHGGMVIHGRSDATLNPGGVRIGTAEIYRQVEKVPEVLECIAIGQNWEGDVRVVLFIKLKKGVTFTPDLEKKIKEKIRQETTPRHVPAKVIAVPDIPKTRNGKIMELAVFQTIHNMPVKNKESLENPACLDFFKNLSALSC
ncbi:MAG: acetoacetate--CoA ligase [Alphaproteobacteria bacterium]